MQQERRTSYVGLRLTPTEQRALERICARISEIEGKPVTVSSVVLRLIDAGLPALDEQYSSPSGSGSPECFKHVSFLSARRSVVSALNSLNRGLQNS